MAIDEQRLSRLRGYEDPDAGVSETFLEERLGPGGALALLTSPLGEQRPLAWVLVPSIGPEHGNLRRLETLLARRLAAAGFPTLRIRPDVDPSRGVVATIDVSRRLAEAEEASALARRLPGISGVGLAGVLFGGTVAALLAPRVGARGLALVEPVAKGKRYVRETVRRQAVAELMAATDGEPAANGSPPPAAAEPPPVNPLEELAAAGTTTIRGLELTQEEFERVSDIDLDRDLAGWAGQALLVGISPTGALQPGLRTLAERLRSLGAPLRLELLEDPLPAPLGEYYYRNEGPIRVDTRLALDERLATLVASWAGDELGGTPGEAAA